MTLEDYLRDNADKTEANFAELKALPDEIYYRKDKEEYRVSHRNVSISGMEDALVTSAPFVNTELIQEDEEKKALGAVIRLLGSGKLTAVQKSVSAPLFPEAFHKTDCETGRCPSADSLMWAGKN